MNVLLAPSQFFPHLGGVEELTLKIAQHLQSAGARVTVVANRHPSSLSEQETIEGVDVLRLGFDMPGRRPSSWSKHHRCVAATRSALDHLETRPDLVHVVCPSVQLDPVARWARSRQVPVVITSQGETEMDAGRLYQRSRWMRRRLRQEASVAAAVTSCSRWTAQAAAKVAPEFGPGEVITNGVDPGDWASDRPRTANPVVVAWGRHVPQKGFDLLLDAWPRVRDAVPGAVLRIGGDGPELSSLQSRDVEGAEFVGPLDRAGVADLLAGARVAVVPSRIEPFGIVALEALAAGRGLVYAAGTGLSEAAGPCGRAAPVTDAALLAEAVVAELGDPVPAAAALEHVSTMTWDVVVEKYRRVYEAAISGTGA